MKFEHKEIWLQPWCNACETTGGRFGGDGRQWCQDNVWDKCDECEREAVRYVLAPIKTGYPENETK